MWRNLCRILLLLHPPRFRRRFAPEMVDVFDQSAIAGTTSGLFRDGLTSLARQWLLRSERWKHAAAVLLACLQITAGGLIWPGTHRHALAGPRTAAVDQLMGTAVWSVTALALAVASASLWLKHFLHVRSRK